MDLAAHRPSPMEPVDESVTEAEIMFAKRGGCCFFIPCLPSNPSSSSSSSTIWWQRIHPASGSTPWWRRALLKVREWSELVAGPRWKTFLRRFRRGAGAGAGRTGRFQYDPLSYARNFDEGGALDDPLDADGNFRGFSARYASVPSSAKSSMDLGGRDAPTLFFEKIGS